MVGFIGAIAMGIAAIIIATRGLGIMVKCVNYLFDSLENGLEQKKRERNQQKIMNRKWD